LDKKFVRCNKAFCEFIGYSETDLIGKSIADITFSEDVELGMSAMRDLVDGKINQSSIQKRYIRKDGVVVWGEISICLVSDENNQPLYFIPIIQDITERKQAEKLLIESEERFQLLFNKAPLGYQSLDFDGNFIDVNQQWLDSLGYERNEVIGKWFGDFLTPVYKNGFIQRFPIFKAQGQIHSEFEMIHKNGAILFIAFDGRVGYNANGDFKQTHCILQDITERKRVEDALKESELKYRLLVENTTDVVFCVNEKGEYKFTNQVFAQTFGKTPDYFIGKTFWDIYPKEEADHRFGAVKEMFRTGESQTIEVRVPLPDRTLYYLAKANPIKDETGKVILNLTTATDITERKLAEEEIISQRNTLSAVFESSPFLLMLLDKNGKIIKINKLGQAFAAIENRAIIDEYCGDVFNCINVAEGTCCGDHENCSQCAIRRSLDFTYQTGIPVLNCEGILKREIGGKLELVNIILSTNIVEQNGEQIVLVSIVDVTEIKKTEELIKINNERLELAMQTANMAWWEMDIETGNEIFEKRKAEMLGYSAEKFRHYKDFMALVHVDDHEKAMEAMRLHISSKKERYEVEYRILCNSGEYKWFYDIGTIVKTDTDGKPIKVTGLVIDISERKSAEEKIIESQEKYRILVENTETGFVVISDDGKVISANESYMELAGLNDSKEIFGKSVLDWTAPDEIENNTNAVRLCVKNGYINDFETIYEHKNGKRLNIIINASVYKSTEGHTQIVSYCRNITERKHAEEMLLKSKERYSKLLENVETGIVVHAPDTSIILNNPRAAELLGLSDNQIKGKKAIDPVWRFINEDGSALPFDQYPVNRIVESKQAFRNQTIGVTQPNKKDIVWLLINGLPILNSQGEITDILIRFIDITELKSISAVQEFLIHCGHSSSGEEFFESLAKFLSQHLSMSYVCIDRLEGDGLTAQTLAIYNGGEYESNVSYALKETPCGDVVGKTICCFPENVCELFPYDQALQDLKAVSYIGTTLWSFDGKAIGLIALIDQKPIRNVKLAEAVLKLVAVRASAELERKQAELELVKARDKAQESDRLKTAFLQKMSHEIRTPMNGILGFSYLLSQPGLNSDKQQEYIRIINKSGDRMINILNEIMDISKIESGLVEAIISDVNVNEKVKSVYDILKLDAADKSISFSFDISLPDSAASIKTDGDKLFGILSNLVKNAIKYSDNGSIEFGYFLKGKNIEFFVKDTGIGIPEDRQDAIFERFIQADIADVQARQGAGLGLSISKAFVELLGGKIWVESDLGKGSVFYFTLPYNRTSAKIQIVENAVSLDDEEKDIAKLKILIVEDDEVSEILFSNYIQQYGKLVLSARNGAEAVDIFNKNSDIDLILMDMSMPVMNGYDATRIIRQLNKEVIIIGLTAFAQETALNNAIDSGCNECIAKPVSKEQLMELVRAYFELI
jgi:hypothetical protein